MAQTLSQKIVFKNTNPKALYDLYMNSKKHSVATGAPAKMSAKVGGEYSVHGGYISGKNLHLVKDSLIVQSWRAKEWAAADVDSTFILRFEKKAKNVVVHMIHANVPDKQAEGILKGWNNHYWEPWKKFLAGKPIAKSPTM
jgi:activator of HSP90 ATPase